MLSSVRRTIFQIHLWVGIALSIYLLAMGVTGSILVFRDELEHAAHPWPFVQGAVSGSADVAAAIREVRSRYPKLLLDSIEAASRIEPGLVVVLQGQGKLRVGCEPVSGAILGELAPPPRWLNVIEDVHERLLMGHRGRLLNGVGGLFLLGMCATGLVLWWPRGNNWRRGFFVDFRRNWRRINFDLHGAAGIWMLLLIAFWGASGVYFAWPSQVFAVVTAVSPIINSTPPRILVVPRDGEADVNALVRQARALDPRTTWKGVRFPFGPTDPIQVVMARGGGDGTEYEDILFFDPYTGVHLRTWRYGVNQSFGDWLIWAQSPLHMGTAWGLGVKIVWSLAGLGIPLLAVTGLLMYWNRTLRHVIFLKP